MKLMKWLGLAIVTAAVVGLGVFAFDVFEWKKKEAKSELPAASDAASKEQLQKILLSDQAIENLQLQSKPVKPETYWKSIQIPGIVVDRPGRSDRDIVSPLIGIITQINYSPGDTVRPGESLFKIKLLSDIMHQTQSDLFKATQDIKLVEAQLKRLSAATGAIPEARIIDVENQLTRLGVATKACRRELANRGLTLKQIDEASEGQFVNEITIIVPEQAPDTKPLAPEPQVSRVGGPPEPPQPAFEVQELKVELGQQVQAGQTLCLLSNHQLLAVQGRAFRDETHLLERSVKEGWPVSIDFQEGTSTDWPPLTQDFHIWHLANTIDPDKRTFAFTIRLENQSKTVQESGRTQMLWRFRPGQKVRILVRVERLDNVFVLPTDAVAKDGAEAFVFTQNVNMFDRKPVRILSQDRQHTVVANDGSLVSGSYVVQNASEQLNRMTKSQTSGTPKGYHVHADGSLHKNSEEGK